MIKLKMNRFLYPLLCLLLLPLTGTSQTLQEWTDAADAAYAKGDYYSAYRYYDVALKYDTSRMDLWYRLGESAQEFTAYRTATEAYQRVVASNFRDSFPLLPYRQAQVLQKRGFYSAAASLYKSFVDEDPDNVDPKYLEDAERERINAEWAVDVVERKDDTDVRHLPGDVNSPHSDFGPYYKDNVLYFSTLRYNIRRDTVRPRRSLSRILTQAPANQEIEKLPKEINQDGRLAAHTTFSADGQTAYYTLCDYVSGSPQFRCEIYCSSIMEDGRWGTPQRLPINDDKGTNTHPSVGTDAASGSSYLYFTSDRESGKGGLDIYRAELLTANTCGPVENLEDINTTGNDITPFFYTPTQVLYFSTDGRLSMGGYDIYRAGWNSSGWDRPSHMGTPVNSSYNDLYYARFPERERAYFASNRPDSLAIFWDDGKEACCNDIYSVGITDEIKLLALTYDAIEKLELPGTTVALYELGTAGRRLIDSTYNPTANDFNFTVAPGKQYELVATKPGYSTDRDTVDLTDPAVLAEKNIERKLYLSPDLELDVFTFNQKDSTALAGATVYLYELAPDGELILEDSIVNPTANDHHFKLRRGKQYQVFAQKDGFKPADVVIDTNDPAYAETDKIRKDLYLEPGLFLEVYTYRLLDEKPLTGSTIYLYEYTDAEGEKLVDSLTNVTGHHFGFDVDKGKRYVIRAERDGYGPALTSLDLSGPDVPDSGTYRKDLYLGQLLEIFTYDAVTELPLPGAEIKLVDPRTGEVVAEKINPDGNDFRFSINLDNPYELQVSRKGYKPVTDIISFSQEDLTAGGGKIAFDVFLEPYEDPNTMLPLYLYFDNDQPDPRSNLPRTDKEYTELNVAYFEQKQNFVQSFTESMELEEAFRTRRRFNDFFNLEVRGGRYDLEEFAKRLLVYLEAGNTFKMELKGFASPRAGSVYNEILSKRRIDAVLNFFRGYENEKLWAFYESGALTYSEEPLGETQADPRVTDQLDDEKNSIFNLFASLERRVEVRASTEDEN